MNGFVAEKLPQGQIAKLFGQEQTAGPPTKKILEVSTGFARPGEVLAMMGPSGSGKTTLLNILAQRPTLGKRGYWTGELRLNGQAPWKNWEREMAYVMQKDIFYEELTVVENLLFTGMLRLPIEWTSSQKRDRIAEVIKDLGLEHVRETKIGTAVERGLSGGEVKRVSIANEMLSLPRIFLLDEPLTGLDSSRAVEVMQSLRRLAREDMTTVMLTIHQPSSALYSCFDRLLLLAPGGQMAYFGDVGAAVHYYSLLSYPLPPQWAPSDHFIELLAVPSSRDVICRAWVSQVGETLQDGPQSEPSLVMAPMPATMYQVKCLLPRAFKSIRRTYLKRINWIFHMCLALAWGFIFWNVGECVESKLSSLVGVAFFINTHWSWTPLFQGLNRFPLEKDMLVKERASKVYDIESWFLSQVVAEAPALLVLPMAFFLILWPMAALPLQAFAPVFLVIALCIQVSSAISSMISTACVDKDSAIPAAVVTMVLQMSAGGFFADMRLLPWWISWIRYLSFYFYSFGAILRLLIKEPFGIELYDLAIEKYSMSDLGYVTELSALIIMMSLYRLAAYFQLRFTKRLSFS